MPAGSAFLIKEGMLSNRIQNVDTNNDGVAEHYGFDIYNQSLHAVHPLGWIRKLAVRVDGKEIPAEKMYFVIRGQWICVEQMPTIVDIFWHIREKAQILIKAPGGIAKGKHSVEVTVTASTMEETSILDMKNAWPPRSTTLLAEMQANEEVVRI